MNDNTRTIEAPEIQTTENGGIPFESAIIPRSFWLGGLQIDVNYDVDLYKSKKIVGEAHYPSQSIAIDPSIMKKQSTEQSYFHELIHWILYVMNEDELRMNEKFVDIFSQFLYQARISESREPVVIPQEG